MEPALNNGAEKPPENNPNIPDNSEFSKVVEESAQKVAEAKMPPPKKDGPARGRGRPRKVQDQGQAPQAAATAAPGAVPPGTQVDLTRHLAMPIKLFGSMPARRHKMPELALSDEEAMLCAEAFNGILQAFIPDVSKLSPKAAALITAAVVTGSIFTNKYLIYLEKSEERLSRVEKPRPQVTPSEPVNDGTAPPMPENAIDAGSHFRRR